MLGYIILGISYAFAAAVQPGPFQTYLISQTLTRGWRRTLPAAFAPLLSDGPIIVLVLLVLNKMPNWLIQGLQCAGGAFLLYLAVGAFKTWQTFELNKENKSQTNQETLLKACLVNLLNPAPYIGWSLVMGPLLIKGWRESPTYGIVLLIGFYSTMILVTLGIMLLFSFARNLGPRVSKGLVGISVITLTCFGIYALWLGTGAHLWN
jgi:threonine/homoserine/homoserine lactone efflux protein